MTFLLDTCLVSESMKPKPSRVVTDWLRDQEEIGLYLSVITIGEITRGIAKLREGRKKRGLVRWVEQDLRVRFAGRILDVDRQIAERWGRMSASAEAAGRRVTNLDGLIAATAIENGFTLATRNVKDMDPTGANLFNPWDLGV